MASEVDQLHSQAESLADQFNQGGESDCIEEAIDLARRALELCPQGHSKRFMSLMWLAVHLNIRYSRLGEIEDINEAIALAREALLLCPLGHPDRALPLSKLGIYFSTRYNRLSALDDLDEAIALARDVLLLYPPEHPERSTSLDSLGNYLFTRCNRLGAHDDIDEAITLARDVLLHCPPGHPSRSTFLSNLGSYIFTHYRLGALDDFDEAITLTRDALLLCPLGHPDRLFPSSNLSIYLSTRYNRLGALDDLDEAVTLVRDTLLHCPPGHPSRSIFLNNLGSCLSTRYERFGALDDIDEAITLARDVLLLHPPGHTERSTSLNNLGGYLFTRYNRLSALDDLDEAITLARDAFPLFPPGHPLRPTSLNNLGNYLVIRCHRLGTLEDLDTAITLSREVLFLCPPGHPHRSMTLTNLGTYLSARYNYLGVLDDLDEAITLGRGAFSLRPLGHPLRPRLLHYLACRLHTRYTKLQKEVDRNELFGFYIQLADVQQSTSSDDLAAAREWIAAAEDFRHSSTLLAYQTALRFLIHHLATLPSTTQHLANLKTLTSSLAVDAFSAGIRHHTPIRSVELLEQGRGVFWTQLTRFHSPLDDIIASGSRGKTLADEFARLTSLIRDATNSPGADQHDQLFSSSVKLQRVITEIRKLPHLSRFLLPPVFSDLQQAASGGPIIIVNASKYSCDALIVLVDRDPVHVPLPTVTKKDVEGLSSRFHTLTVRAKSIDVLGDIGSLLRDLWDQVISPIVDVLRTLHPLQSRIWWCPTAEFTHLPLHAAGPCRKDEQNFTDLYISSYTPTITSLIRARRDRLVVTRRCLPPQIRHHNPPDPEAKRLINITQGRYVASHVLRHRRPFIAIGQANATGETELKSVTSELTEIGQLVDGLATFTRIEGPESSIPRVIKELGKNEWAHIACHGIPNKKQPLDSAFALHDGRFTIQRIIQCELENPEFAYLSACHTTVGDEESPDEVIHLAAAMQFLGFRSVIGTMWAVDDAQTNMITKTFYKHLIGDSGHLDYTRAALALHRTMQELNDIVPGDQRILYVHIGA